MTLQEKAQALYDMRKEINKIDKAYDETIAPLKVMRDAIQMEIMAGFKELGTATMRYDFATFSIAVRKTPQIIDESKVIKWLEEKNLIKEYVIPRLAPHFDILLKESIKKDIQIDGIEIRETEYMSITQPKEGDKRKIAID